ncbi:MAG: hypothetical protein QW706_09450 [Candidatus Nezhaarchaeales archaeon]
MSQRKILVTSSEELALKALNHYKRYGGIGTSGRMQYGALLEFEPHRRFLKYIEKGRVYSIGELEAIANSLSGADKTSFRFFLKELPEQVKIYDDEYVKLKDRIPRVFQTGELPSRMLKRCIDASDDPEDTTLICEFSKSYWIVIEVMDAFDVWSEVLLIPKDIDINAMARYLEPEHARKIAMFPLPDCKHSAIEKAKELKALIALLYPGVN